MWLIFACVAPGAGYPGAPQYLKMMTGLCECPLSRRWQRETCHIQLTPINANYRCCRNSRIEYQHNLRHQELPGVSILDQGTDPDVGS
jgi:hypothetical protein